MTKRLLSLFLLLGAVVTVASYGLPGYAKSSHHHKHVHHHRLTMHHHQTK